MNISDWSNESHERHPSVLAHDLRRNRWDYIVEPLDELGEDDDLNDISVEMLLWITFCDGKFTVSTWAENFIEIFRMDLDLEHSQVKETEHALTRWGVKPAGDDASLSSEDK